MHNHIDLDFANGSYTFRLNLPQIRCIEAEAKAGIGEVAFSLFEGRYYADVVYEIVRQGLIGGNACIVNGIGGEVPSFKANELLQNYVIGQPLNQAVTLAKAVLTAALVGYEPSDETQKKSGMTSQEESQGD
jgi:Phage tail tube protein, GTA-gp10